MAEESKSSSSTGLKVALGIAIAAFLITGFYTMNLYNSSKDTQKILEEEKQSVLADFKALGDDYEEILSENKVVNENLVKANDSIQGLIESLQRADADVNTLKMYKSKYNSLLKERKFLLAQNDSLRSANKYLKKDLDSTRVSLEQRKVFSDSLLAQNSALANVVDDASVLSTTGLVGAGIIEKGSGKLIPTEKASRVDKIRVCYSVAKNNLVASGEQELYIQVLDPKSNIMGSNKEVFLKKSSINCSVVSKFNYEKRSLDICEYITSNNGGEFAKGTYTIKIYNRIEMVASSEFTLN